jgi:hypothetical protein
MVCHFSIKYIAFVNELDEMYRFGRNTFQQSMQLSHRKDPSLIDWTHFKYQVFDIPTHPAHYQQRYLFLGISFHYYYYFID